MTRYLFGFLDWPGWTDLTVWGCWLGLALAGSFVVRYHLRTHGAWRDTSDGRWMMYGRVLIASVLALTLINYYFRPYHGQRFVSFLFFALYIAHLYWPHVLLSQAHRDHEHKGEHRRDRTRQDRMEDARPGARHVPDRNGRARVDS